MRQISSGTNVGREADLERDPEVVDVLHEVGVLDQPRAVADPIRPTVVERLVDRLRPVGLTRVDGRGHVAVDDREEGVPVLLGRVVVLRPRQVEGHHAAALVRHGEVGEVAGGARLHVADPADDEPGADSERLFGLLEAPQGRVDGLHEGEPLTGVQDRRVANLEIADVLPRVVLGQLEGDALERRRVLHHGDRDGELGEVLLQVLRVVGDERPAQRLGLGLGQRHAVLLRQLQHGLRTQAPVQVYVQLGFRKPFEQVARQGQGRTETLSGWLPGMWPFSTSTRGAA